MRAYLLFTLMLSVLTCVGQQYQFWQGTGGYVDFRTEPPTIAPNGEGDILFTGSICDDSSEVLFYFTHPWPSKNHHFRLMNSANQAIIPSNDGWYIGFGSNYRNVLLKANDSIYYLFYAAVNPSNTGRLPGFYYTKLNRHLRNGLGDIVPGFEDVPILSAPCVDVFATQTSSGSWWVYTNSGDTIVRVKVDEIGISSPKTQYFPSTKSKFQPERHYGTTRISPHNKKVIRKEYGHTSYSNPTFWESETVAYLFDYDEVTGTFSKPTLLFQSNYSGSTMDVHTRPILIEMEFSPNDSFVYLLYSNSNLIDTTKTEVWLSQYETFAANPGNTVTALCRTNDPYFEYVSRCYNLRLGQNQKMYLGTNYWSTDIGLIEYPNKKGSACRLQIKDSLKFLSCSASGNSGCYADNYPFSRFHGLKMDFKNTQRCSDSAILIENLCDTSKFHFYQWFLYSVNEPGKLLDSSTSFAPVFSHYDSGHYYICLQARTPKGFRPWFSDTIQHYPVFPAVSFSILDSVSCRYTQVLLKNLSTLNISNPNLKPTWTFSFSDGRDTSLSKPDNLFYTFMDTGYYHVSLEVFNGYCTSRLHKDSFIYIWNAPRPGIAINDTLGCQPLQIHANRLYRDSILVAYFNSGITKDSFPADSLINNDAILHYSYNDPGIYWLRQTLIGPSGCTTHDSVRIHVQRGFYPNEQSDIQLAGVMNNDSVLLISSLHPAGVNHILEKSLEKTRWTFVDTLHLTTAIDIDVNVQKQSYYYQIRSVDSCGLEHVGQIGTSMWLQGNNSTNEVILLTWTSYENWNQGVLHYNLEYQDQFDQWISLTSFQDTSFAHRDFLESGINSICYRVSAWKDIAGDSISYSNETCVDILPIIWIPNAFSPNGDLINDVFLITTYGIVEMNFEIFNRYGERVFQGNGLNDHWNGTFKGEAVPEGVYLIRIHGKNQNGEFFHENSNLTLLR